MPARKTNKQEGGVGPAKPSGVGDQSLGSTPTRKPSKGNPSPLNDEERALLKAIDDAPEPLRYDLIMEADRDLVKALIRKKEIRFRKIQRSPIQGTIPREAIRKAVIAVKRAREKAGNHE